MLCSIIVVQTPRMSWDFRNDCQTECSLVCANTDSSSDSCFWFSSIPFHSILLHSTSFNSIPRSTSAILQTALCYIFTLVVPFFVSSTVAFLGTEVAIHDPVVSCSWWITKECSDTASDESCQKDRTLWHWVHWIMSGHSNTGSDDSQK